MRYFSTFSGIAGFELGIEKACPGAVCVGYSEIDKYADAIYQYNFKGAKNYGDITKINGYELPDFDLLVGGFPCQAFSIAGKRRGFEDTRGTLFFDLARILQAKRRLTAKPFFPCGKIGCPVEELSESSSLRLQNWGMTSLPT